VNWREKALLRPRELAEVSGRSRRTIERKIRSGVIESRLEDGCRVIPIAAARRFVGEGVTPSGVERSPAAEKKAADILSHFRRKHG